MTHEDRWRLECLDHAFEVRHDRGRREAFDRRWIAVERFDLDRESRIRWGEHAVAPGFVACDPVLPASRRHPEAMDEYDRIGTFRWRRHSASPCRVAPTGACSERNLHGVAVPPSMSPESTDPKSDDIVVFEILRDSKCAECGDEL